MAEPVHAEKQAQRRFLLIGLVRFSGVAMILLGLVVANGNLDWPQWTAYVLIGIGMVDTFVFPTLLARRWSSNTKP